jgi:alpha-L-fucosidase 2
MMMKPRMPSFLIFLLAFSAPGFPRSDPSTVLWYAGPAEKWEDALPVGNGRLGAMYFGGIGEDRLQFNEETYWTGGPYSTVVKGGYRMLPEIRTLLFEGRPIEAHLLFGRHLLGNPVEQQKYQSMGNVILRFSEGPEASAYRRELDLGTGIASAAFTRDGIRFMRELFASHPDQAIVMRIAADRPGAVSFECQLQGVRNQTHSNYATDYFHMDPWGEDGLKLTGKGADYLGIEGKIRYEARLQVRLKGGRIIPGVRSLRVEGADEAVLILVAATNFNSYKDVSGDCTRRVEEALSRLADKDFDRLKENHVRDHRALFDRVKLELPITASAALPTDVRLQRIKDAPDPSLAALCYQFGRYLMIASSRPGTEAANLQGIWNNDANPWWDSKYTTNINLEMNYWNADAGNLSECAAPLFDLVREVSDQGLDVAREHYGVRRGWVFHQNTDLWRVAAPMDGANWGTFTMGGAWLATHIWDHYLYTDDLVFLRENYLLLKGAAEFFLDFLVEDPVRHWLVTNPSTSPENPPGSPRNGRFFDEMNGTYYAGSQICYGSTIDTQILLDLFAAAARAAEVLGLDGPFREEVLKARSRLPPMQVGKNGSLQEWIEDWPQMEKNHRHYSHLYGVFPGGVISPLKTPDLVEPVKRVLEQRGDGSTGWSRAWKMGIWARLFDGNRANRIFKGYLQETCTKSLFSKCGQALQVDGSFGVSAAVSEMLVQSYEGYLQLLPALPEEWAASGRFSGVVARGAFELDFAWTNGAVGQARLISRAGRECRIKTRRDIRVRQEGRLVPVVAGSNGVRSFPTKKDGIYTVEFAD